MGLLKAFVYFLEDDLHVAKRRKAAGPNRLVLMYHSGLGSRSFQIGKRIIHRSTCGRKGAATCFVNGILEIDWNASEQVQHFNGDRQPAPRAGGGNRSRQCLEFASFDLRKKASTMNSETITVWEGKHLRVRTCGRWEYVERTRSMGGVVIVAVTNDSNLLLVEQYRVPLGKRVIELPAGLAGDTDGTAQEELVEAARRELLEETGYEASEWAFLMAGPSSAGLTNEVNTMFRASGLRCAAPGGGDEHEQIHLHAIPISEVHSWLNRKMKSGFAVDPKVYAGLYFLQHSPKTAEQMSRAENS